MMKRTRIKSCDSLILSMSNKKAAKKCFDFALSTQKGKLLFISGPSPSGKTHLLRETAKLYESVCGQVPLITTATELTDDYTKIIGLGEKNSFYNKYTSSKLILIDDLQFIAKMSTVQKGLFEVFEKIMSDGADIILFSEYSLDCYEMFSSVSERFMQTEIKKSDFSLKRKYLDSVLYNEKLKIPDRVYHKIVFNNKMELSSIKGCVGKIKLLEDVYGKALAQAKMLDVIREYERI